MNFNVKKYTYDKYLDGDVCVLDSHCHIGLFKNTPNYENIDLKIMSFGTLPEQYDLDKKLLSSKISVGLGFHPWQARQDYDKKLNVFLNKFSNTNLIGEIGLDFSKKHQEFALQQTRVFETICNALRPISDKIVSVHAVKSSAKVLEILRKNNCFENHTIIFHWFSGSLEELKQALNFGAYFSVGPKMFISKKGKSLIAEIPENRLLVETDLPWSNNDISAETHMLIINDFLIRLRSFRENSNFEF